MEIARESGREGKGGREGWREEGREGVGRNGGRVSGRVSGYSDTCNVDCQENIYICSAPPAVEWEGPVTGAK